MKKDLSLNKQDYQYGFHDNHVPVYRSEPGLSRKIVEEISFLKQEHEWMRNLRLQALDIFNLKTMPSWGADLSRFDFKKIIYYVRPSDKKANTWEDVPQEIKNTFDKIGVPEAEKK